MPTFDLGKVTGPQGPQGIQGPQGEHGEAATIQVGQVVTGAAGTQAAVENTGTEQDVVLKFTIPKGDQGIQGPQGPQGIQGIEGPQGVKGNDGVTPNIQVGTVATLAAGSAATVTRQAGSPDAAPVFDFGIPKGADAVNPGDMTKAVYDPTAKQQDVFAYADQKMPKSGGAFTGVVSGVSPTSGSTKGFRNIYFGSGTPATSLGANGDIYFKI